MTDTEATILKFIEETVPGIEFDLASDGDRPLSEVGIDSLDRMSVLLAVQEHWNLDLPAPEIEQLKTFNDICRKVG